MSESMHTAMAFAIGLVLGSVLARIIVIPILERYFRERKKHR